MASISEIKWKLLTAVPSVQHDITNRCQFHIVFDPANQSLYALHKTRGLLQYSFETNTWNSRLTMNDLPSTFFDDAYTSICTG